MKHLVQIDKLCSYYQIDFSFFDQLYNFGLINIEIVDENKFINQDVINDLEKIIRLHKELNVNIEGIDIIFNLLEREAELKKQIVTLQNRLGLYEEEN